MATCGPWLEPTPWRNLNVQLEHWLIHGSNHLELDAVTRALSEFRDNLAKKVTAPYRADSLGVPRTTDTRTPAEKALIEKSLAHWVGFEGALQGYTFTGAASISAPPGKGDDALMYLGRLMSRFTQANTMYKESGPVIETPLSAAQSLHDMVCQSWGDAIRVFPALPAARPDLVVHDFRTQGAFLLSAVREQGGDAVGAPGERGGCAAR